MTAIGEEAARVAEQVGSFTSRWERAVADHGDRPFLVFAAREGDTRCWSYREFDRVVSGTARALQNRGVGAGDAIHLALANCPSFIAVWLAAARVGAWIIPTDPRGRSGDFSEQIGRARPVIGLCASARAADYHAGARGQLASVVELAEDATDVEPGGVFAPSNEGSCLPGAPVSPLDRLAVMFTSGTTSRPKGVVLTQANYAYIGEAMSKIVGMQPEHRWLVVLPLFHANAQYYCVATAISAGASVGLTYGFSASRWAEHARTLEATHASLFAAPIRMILSRRPKGTQPLQLEEVWFAQNLTKEQYREFSELTGCMPRQLYGMTETTAIVFGDLTDTPQPDTIGGPVLDRPVRVVVPGTGRPAPPGVPGDLHVAGIRGVSLFLEYLDDPVATDAAFRVEGSITWFVTGDRVVLGDEGRYRFVGRTDDVIKVAGENVSLVQIEATLGDAPGVLELAVVAHPDPMLDRIPVAYVVPADPTAPPAVTDLISLAAQRLAPASRPRRWYIVDELPRTSVGKVQRFLLQPERPLSGIASQCSESRLREAR